jgi:acyl-coenzyme A synthetase/AMP-(fatty) acid ligase
MVILVRGISKRVIVVDSPDKRFFEQAIFIVRSDAFDGGATSRQILDEACRVAGAYARTHVCARRRALPRIPAPVYAVLGCAATGAVWLAIALL